MAIFGKATGFWDSFSFAKDVRAMRKVLMEYFKDEGVTYEVKDGSLLFEYEDSWYIVNFATGNDYAECAIIYSLEDKKYAALEQSNKTFIAAKTNNEVDNHAVVYVYNDSIKVVTTFYFTSKRMMMELFSKHFDELRGCIDATLELTGEYINEAQDAAEENNRTKKVGFCVPEEDETKEMRITAKKDS